MTAVQGHELVGKRVTYRGHVWPVRHVVRNPAGPHEWSGRLWLVLGASEGPSTTAWLDDVEPA